MRKALTLAISAAILLAMAAPAFAYPPRLSPRCRANDTRVEPGQTVLFGGRFWDPGVTVTAGFNQKLPGPNATVIKTTTTNAEGQWQVSITIPSNVRNGAAVFGAIGTEGAHEGAKETIRCIFPVRVVGAAQPANASSTTEQEPAGVTAGMATGLVFALLGAHLVIRRRRMKSLLA
jgi:hypothetical protein